MLVQAGIAVVRMVGGETPGSLGALVGYLFADDAAEYVEREQPAWQEWLVGVAAGAEGIWAVDYVITPGLLEAGAKVVDLSGADDLVEGDWISLPYDLPGAAQRTSLSQYELLTILGRRFG